MALLLCLGFQTLLAAGDGRIAVVADGNYRDTDDVCGTPVSMAVLHSLGFADKLVHYSHSCDITPAGKDAGQGQEAERERMMQVSCDGTADRWGAFPNVTVYFNCKREYDAAVEDLKDAINASTGSDLLYIIEAGEPDVIYDAMVAANQKKRSFVRIITHHPHNDRGDRHDLSDIEALAGVSAKMVTRIPDQNTGLKNKLSDWHWARDHSDSRITWLWDRGKIAEDPSWGYRGIRGSFDCSDAGMIWYWATGKDDCSMADLKSAFTTYVNNNPAPASVNGCGNSNHPQESIYNESGGLVVIEAENTPSPLDLWKKGTTLENHTGSGYLQFLGNTWETGPPKSPLDYRFKINRGGLYYLHLHCAKEEHEGRDDVANDAYIRVEGDYESGPGPHNDHGDNASLLLLKRDTKYYGGAIDAWKWEDGSASKRGNFDPGGESNKRMALYNFKAGETYRLVVSGRSKYFRINRLVFRHADTPEEAAHELSTPESERVAPTADHSYDAIENFPEISKGEISYTREKSNQALSIDASVVGNRSGFARASRSFDGDRGLYDVKITTMTEEDGESTYRLLVDGKEVANFQNPHVGKASPRDRRPHSHWWKKIPLTKGDVFSIESNAHTNGEIPEDGGTAWSRGRWQKIEFFQVGELPTPRTSFDKKKDLLIAQFDTKPDADDVHAQAALGSMLLHPDFEGVNYFAVSGAIGEQNGKFINSRKLFKMAFGAEDTFWTDARKDWDGSVSRIRDQAKAVLDAGGTVWVQEAGQSNLTKDWIEALLAAGVSASDIKNRVVVVQHSLWNEEKSNSGDLDFVQSKTNYRSIDDGNADPGDYSSRALRGDKTPNYVSAASSWIKLAKAADNPNAKARELWTEADRIIEASGFDASYSEIPGGGIDFSDCVENWWIFELGQSADSVSTFWNRFVVNTPTP
jgi:hypothetical protein